ncbi:MAG: HAD family hydrolase [Gammaproteobacteria bacterium]|nr:MAG: HAD family hydrolase [Gammaproteobacteria bacterium]
MPLAIFDLDNTLLSGDSDYLWGQYLCDLGVVDREHYEACNLRFYEDYRQGRLDILAFLAFSLRPLAENDPADLARWRAEFIDQRIRPLIGESARELVASHRQAGDTLLIITATNSFVTRPIAELFGIEHLIATEPEQRDGRFTGRVSGTPAFREGKVERLQAWLRETGQDLRGSSFYSDSHNDLPLLQQVDRPVAVDPDPALRAHAERVGWPIISLHQDASSAA